MTQDEFNKILTLFGVLVGILIIFNSNIIIRPFSWSLNIILLIIGVLSLGSMLLDMTSNMSCKNALRERSVEIENILTNDDTYSLMKIWRKVIPEREKYFEEKIFKKLSKKIGINWFIIAGRMLIIIWIILVLIVIRYDPIPKIEVNNPF